VAARGAYRECTSSARGAFLDAIDGCLERDHECVDSCRLGRQDCRDRTGIGAGLASCNLLLEAEKRRCRDRFPLIPKRSRKRRESCIERAEISGLRCRSEVRRRFRQARRDCRQEFEACTDACGAGGPPGGSGACKQEGRSAVGAVLADCKLTFQTTSSGCVNKDVTCVQGCADARTACEAPTRAALDAAIAACRAAGSAAVAACLAANPAGSSALQQCITGAQADAYVCLDAALDAAAPGLAACVQPYVSCVAACPPPS
jgi:hypothetical protein